MAIKSFDAGDGGGKSGQRASLPAAQRAKTTTRKPTTAVPKKAKTQAEMTYGELTSKGPMYGSQAARVANQSTSDLAKYVQSRVGGGSQNQNPGTVRQFQSPDMMRGAGSGGGIVQGAQAGGGFSGGGTQSISPTGQVSTGGGGGGGVVGQTGAPVTGQLTDYGYSPFTMGQIYDNPSILTGDMLENELGITNAALADVLAQYFDPALGSWFLANSGDPNSATDAATLNGVLEYMGQLTTPNGQMPDYVSLLNNLFGATSGDTPLGSYLQYDPKTGRALSASDQVGNANQLMSSQLVGLNPYAQEAYAGAMGRAGRDYIEAGQRLGSTGAPDPGSSYMDYLGGTPLRDWFRR